MNDHVDILISNIKAYRKELGLSQQDLADKADVSLSFITDIENSRRLPSLKSLFQIASALNVEPYLLLVNPDKYKNDSVEIFADKLLKKIKEDIDTLKRKS